MNYSKKFNTTKKAVAEIKRLENECARLAKMDLCEWSITLEQHINDKNKEIEELQIKNDNQKKIIQGTHRYRWSTEQREEVARLKSEIVQFRKTQDYQSDKIGELLEEVEALKHGDALADRMIESKNATIQRLIAQRDSLHETKRDVELNAKQLAGTIIRQANELTDLKAGV